MDILIILPLLIGFYFLQRGPVATSMARVNPAVPVSFVDLLFAEHLLLWLVYLLYAYATRSDSFEYYNRSVSAGSIGELFGSGTTFIRFLAYPFSNTLGLSFNSVMLIFSFIGFQGLLLFYLAGLENIRPLPAKWGGFTVLELLFFLPNTHFWSSSLGKGSVMLFAIGLSFWGLSRFNRRLIPMLLGCILVYFVRPHILFAMVLGVGMGLLFTSGGLKWTLKLPLLVLALGAVFLISDDVVEFSGSESVNVLESTQISKRAAELSKGGSGVDISNYNQAEKLFTFLFRPLFIDAPGVLGLITSFENLLLLVIAFYMVMYGAGNFGKWNGFYQVSIFIFLLASVALAQVTGNLGIAMRQKAQVMPIFFLVYARVISLKYWAGK